LRPFSGIKKAMTSMALNKLLVYGISAAKAVRNPAKSINGLAAAWVDGKVGLGA